MTLPLWGTCHLQKIIVEPTWIGALSSTFFRGHSFHICITDRLNKLCRECEGHAISGM
jgi:hypothetical protein